MPEIGEIKVDKYRIREIWIPCIDCGKCRWIRMSQKHPRCKSCAQRKPRVKGEIMSAGYVLIYRPDHPFSQPHGRIKRARLVLEQKLGRYLLNGMIPHHKNEIKDDDCPENLEEMPRGKHQAMHVRRRHGKV